MGCNAGLGLLLSLACFSVSCVATYNVEISPAHIRISEETNTVTISCTAGIPLDGCQFKWWDFYQEAGPTLDFGRGAESTSDPAHLSTTLANYTYSGRGLETGDCGVTLYGLEGWKTWMVACRVKSKGGSWSYKWTDLYSQGWDALSSFVAPRETVAVPGGMAKFLVLAKEPLTSCHFFLPAAGRLVLDEGNGSAHSTESHAYYGLGLDRGECGLVLRGITANENGLVRAWVATNSTPPASDTVLMALVVASPERNSVKMSSKVEGTWTEYSCGVDAHPLPTTVTWSLGGEVIRRDGADDRPGSPVDQWEWPWQSGRHLEQRVKVDNRPENEGQTVKCSFSSQAFRWPVHASHVHSNTKGSTLMSASTSQLPPTSAISTAESLNP